MPYERVVFLCNSEAEEALEVLDSEGPRAAIDMLANWHFPDEHETADEPSAGTSDVVYRDGGYILTYNRGLGYIGLEYKKD